MSEGDQEHSLDIDPEILTHVVRQGQQDPDLQVLDWTAAPLSDKGIINPEGLIRVSGHAEGRQGRVPWAVVLKRFLYADTDSVEQINVKLRELRIAESGFFDYLPAPLAAPRCYRAYEYKDGGDLWMELIHDETPPRWSLDDFTFAANEIGRFNAACLGFTQFNQASWLAPSFWKGWFSEFTSMQYDQVWGNPYAHKAIPTKLRIRQKRLIAEKEHFFAAFDGLPYVISHNDFQRRNLMIRKRPDGSRELVACDWAECGLDPLGADLTALIGTSAGLFEIDPIDLPTYDQILFAAYLDGLRSGGWQGDPDEIRLAYTIGMALSGGVVPSAIMFWTSEEMIPYGGQQFGCGPDEYTAGWAEIFSFALDRADEARILMNKLNFI